VRDMLEVLCRRWPAVEVWICPVRVQGEGAALEIATAIDRLNHISRKDGCAIDVLLLGRGGGSLEDLWPFNEEIVADAIYLSSIPIVTGIGHEDDLTISDLVADLRALTPTEAAERIVPDRTQVLEWLAGLEMRFRSLLSRRLELARARLEDLAGRRCFRLPLERIRDEERGLDEWSERLGRAIHQQLQQARQKIEAAAARLEGLSPLNVLARGYSLTRKEADQTLLTDVCQVQPGDRLVTRLRQGQVVSRVEEVAPPM
jgi:exodeoxyribonuclease VII large subunit